MSSIILKILELSFILLFVYSLYQILKLIKKDYLQKAFLFLDSNRVFFAVSFLYILISALKSTYYLGGDDSRLYYLFPEKFYENFTSHIGSDTGISSVNGFLPPSSFLLFNILLIILKKVSFLFNLQSLMFSSNIVLGLVYFYKLVSLFVKPKNYQQRLFIKVSSLFYIFSVFNFYTTFSTQLLSTYLLSIYPLGLYYFFKSILSKNYLYLLITSLLWSVFSAFLISLPWFSALVLVTLPGFFLIFNKHKLQFLKSSFVLLILLILFNLHWIVYVPHSSSFVQNTVSSQFKETANAGIKITAELLNIFYTLHNTYSSQIQENFSWPTLPVFQNWYKYIFPLNLILIINILLAGKKAITSSYKSVYISTMISLLLSMYFFTVNVGSWGIAFFSFLVLRIPGFVMFRNMFDKFSTPLAFSFAFSLAVSLFVLTKKWNKDKIDILLLTLISLTLLNAYPFFSGWFENLPIWTTRYSYQKIESLSDDYLELADFASKLEGNDKFVFLPLSSGNIVRIEDHKNINNLYSGVSPFLIMSGKNDFSGLMSFGYAGDTLGKALLYKRYAEVGLIFQKFNIRYLVVDRRISQDIADSYVFSGGLFEQQSEEFYDNILGNKLASFGEKYDLYEINKLYDNRKLYLDDSPIDYQRVSDREFVFNISEIKSGSKIVFLEGYNKAWKLYLGDKLIKNQPDFLAYSYANGWSIDPELFKGNAKSIELKIKFEPDLLSFSKKADNSINIINEFTVEPITKFDLDKSKLILPYVSTNPNSLKYFFLKTPYEEFQIFSNQYTSLFFADKRVSEILKWGNSLDSNMEIVKSRYINLMERSLSDSDIPENEALYHLLEHQRILLEVDNHLLDEYFAGVNKKFNIGFEPVSDNRLLFNVSNTDLHNKFYTILLSLPYETIKDFSEVVLKVNNQEYKPVGLNEQGFLSFENVNLSSSEIEILSEEDLGQVSLIFYENE